MITVSHKLNVQTTFRRRLAWKFPADLVTVTEEILNGKFHFLCSGISCV